MPAGSESAARRSWDQPASSRVSGPIGLRISEVVLLCWTDGGLAKVDSGFDYAANFSSFACVA